MQFGKAIPYDVHIIPSRNKGFRVDIGCAMLVFKDRKDLINFLDDYLDDPEGNEKKYNDAVKEDSRAEVAAEQPELQTGLGRVERGPEDERVPRNLGNVAREPG